MSAPPIDLDALLEVDEDGWTTLPNKEQAAALVRAVRAAQAVVAQGWFPSSPVSASARELLASLAPFAAAAAPPEPPK